MKKTLERRDAPSLGAQMRACVLLSLLLLVVAGKAAEPPASTPLAAAEHAGLITAFEKQLAALDTAVSQAPEDGALRSRRGDLRLFLGRFHESIEDFEKMIALDPAQDAPHWRLGIAYYFAREWKKSAQQFEKYHAHDGRDRENGIWKFLAQAKDEGIEKARVEMLVYTRFDREPFPALYEMFAGRKPAEELFSEIINKGLEKDTKVMFFAHYYAALNEELLAGERASLTSETRRKMALAHLEKALACFTPETASRGGPGYMWQVARLHLETLK